MPPTGEVRRDRYGRPLIRQLDGSEVAYSRASGITSVIEDDYKLQRWQERQTAIGLAQRPDLILAVNAHRDDRDRIDHLVGKCKDAAKSDARATIGTGIHAITETLDRGEDPGYMPREYEADVQSYLKRTRPLFEHLAIEVFTVCDSLQTAGTPDRVSRLKRSVATPDGTELPAGTVLITDLKTSESLKYGGIKFAAQLGVYAHGLPYDIQAEKRQEWGYEINQDWGVIFHTPAGQGTTSLYWVDIKSGWHMAELAIEVKRARQNWDLLKRGSIETETGATFVPWR